jgi:hypothetical protein
MTRLFLLSLLFLAICTGCDKDDLPVADPTVVVKACDFDLGAYTLHPTTVEASLYKKGQKITFVDSLNNTMVIKVAEVLRSTHFGNSVHFFYNYFVQGDTVRMCYRGDYLTTSLQSSDGKIVFSHSIGTNPLHSDPRSGKYRDVLNIILHERDDPRRGVGVFGDVIHHQNSPAESNGVKKIPSFSVFSKTFTDVRYNEYENSGTNLWYNTTEGIVAFKDHDGTLWRFEKVE